MLQDPGTFSRQGFLALIRICWQHTPRLTGRTIRRSSQVPPESKTPAKLQGDPGGCCNRHVATDQGLAPSVAVQAERGGHARG